ncbi:hypothetical protein O0L34_g10144 [Tuta absoluta]|nr:hypothetical protein O0L34_g10144 [Tuta absoluta]
MKWSYQQRHLLVACTALTLALTLKLVSAYHGPDLPSGPYCGLAGRRGGCCNNRRDDCAHKILDTLCYCDEFCNASRVVDDCCPDYEEVCLGIRPTPPPQNLILYVCMLGQKRTEGCHKCICELVNGKPGWSCDQDPCLVSEEVIHGVNGGYGTTWRAANYSKFAGRKLKEGLRYRLGTFPLDENTRHMNSIRYDKDNFPPEFDARKQWPRFISPVMDQGWCGSDWAVSIASIASDRFAILSNGAEDMVMSPQSLLSCNVKGQQGCDGGHIDAAWIFATKYGLVDADCFPYVAQVTRCPYRKSDDLRTAGCRPKIQSRTQKYRMSVPYKIDQEKDIQYELMESGPVQAIMHVYQDFFHYKDGIYRHTKYGNQHEMGLHSVKIIGWGEERGDRYWIVANSWGADWGENGYFRIARGDNESNIESFVIASLSDVNEANQRK